MFEGDTQCERTKKKILVRKSGGLQFFKGIRRSLIERGHVRKDVREVESHAHIGEERSRP